MQGREPAREARRVSRRRYREFKAALEGLDSKRQGHSPLPIIYQWQAPIAGAGTKCAPCRRPARARARAAPSAPCLPGSGCGAPCVYVTGAGGACVQSRVEQRACPAWLVSGT